MKSSQTIGGSTSAQVPIPSMTKPIYEQIATIVRLIPKLFLSEGTSTEFDKEVQNAKEFFAFISTT